MYLEILTISSIIYSVVNGFWRFVGEILSSYLWISYSFYETDDLMEELYAIFVEKFKAYRYQSAYPSLDYISGWCIHCGIPLHVSLTHNKEMGIDILTIGTCRIFSYTFEKFINGFMHKCKDFKTQKKYINRFNYWTSFGKVCRTFNTIFINKNLKHKLINDMDQFINDEPKYRKYHFKWKRTYLFWGPPGTGKTSTISAIATKYEMPIYYIDFKRIEDQYALTRLMLDIKTKAIIVIEDLKSVLTDTNDNNKHSTKMEMILNFLDGFLTPEGIIIITSNNPDQIDKVILRPGRIDRQFHFNLPSKDEIKRMMRFFNKNEDVKKYIGKSHAEIMNELYFN